jgi:DNA polymerase/3'-5' exonuclease PolX
MRIPPSLYSDILDTGDRIIVILEHIDYLLKMRGENSSFGYGAYLFSQLSSPIFQWQEDMPGLKRIDQKVQAVIKEVIKTGRSTYYEQLLGV